jgi:hypothetical protein
MRGGTDVALQDQLYRIRDFLGGRNSTFSEALVAPNESPDDLNVLYRPIGALTKRGGWQRYYTGDFGDGAVRGLHKHYGMVSEDFTYVYVPPNLWSVDPGEARVAVKNDFSPSTFMDFASARDRTYATNFRELPVRTDGSAAGTTTAELERVHHPEAREDLIVGEQGGGGQSYKYGYKFTAYYGREFGESGYGVERGSWLKEGIATEARQFSVWLTIAGDGIVGITTTFGARIPLNEIILPPGAEAVRIYRTQGLPTPTAGVVNRAEVWWAPFYFLEEVRLADMTSDWRDNIPDQELGPLSEIGPIDPLYTPFAKYVTTHADRMFYANCTPKWLENWKKVDFTDNPGVIGPQFDWEQSRHETFWLNTGPNQLSRVYWTQINTPDNVEGFLDVFPQDGDYITGIISVGPNLIVFKRTHVYQILGYSPDDFEVRLVTQNVGCIAPRSIAILPHQEAAIWLAEDGVYTFDGGAVRRASDKIRADLIAIPRENRAMAVGVVHQNRYLLSVAEAT